MKYAKEFFADVIEEIKPLLERHWHEIALNKDKIPFDPDYDKYEVLEEEGILDIFTARDDEDTLCGYCITFTIPHLHYKTTIASNVDILFVTPEHRGKMTGVRLIAFTEQQLKEQGTDLLMHHVKLAHDFSPILLRQGYAEQERIFGKYIGD